MINTRIDPSVSSYSSTFFSVEMGIAHDIRSRYPDLVVETCGDGNKVSVIVHQREMSTTCSAGPIYKPRLLISQNSLSQPQLEFQVFFHSVCKEAYTPEVADTHLRYLGQDTWYVLVFPASDSVQAKEVSRVEFALCAS